MKTKKKENTLRLNYRRSINSTIKKKNQLKVIWDYSAKLMNTINDAGNDKFFLLYLHYIFFYYVTFVNRF